MRTPGAVVVRGVQLPRELRPSNIDHATVPAALHPKVHLTVGHSLAVHLQWVAADIPATHQ
jgi:hypothetical protein